MAWARSRNAVRQLLTQHIKIKLEITFHIQKPVQDSDQHSILWINLNVCSLNSSLILPKYFANQHARFSLYFEVTPATPTPMLTVYLIRTDWLHDKQTELEMTMMSLKSERSSRPNQCTSGPADSACSSLFRGDRPTDRPASPWFKTSWNERAITKWKHHVTI